MTQRKEPTPLAKSEISVEEASNFFSEHYPRPIVNIEELKGGKHSKAFSYEYDGRDLVVRFSTENRGFLKDKYAFEHLGMRISIPRVIEIETYKDLHYCITEKVSGETARNQYNRGNFSSLPLLYDSVEDIAKDESGGIGYGYLDIDSHAPYGSSLEYINSVYESADLFDWDKIFQIKFVDKNFTDYIAEKMKYFARYTTEKKELLHGDFGADNVFIKDGAISGIIDWEKLRCGDHFLDMGRVLFFCPDRQATASAAIRFYENKRIEHWKERAAMGVYHVLLTNYAYAALGGNEASCMSSKTRLKELEQGLGL